MKIRYAARLARLDLLRAVCHLACFITKWTPECDRRLHRLVSYIHTTKSQRMVGWVGDCVPNIALHLYADADFAGCTDTKRSTSGVHLAMHGPHTCYPLSGISKRQGCVSHSTPEAEMVAATFALRQCGLPAMLLWDSIRRPSDAQLAGHSHVGAPQKHLHAPLYVHEDNQAMLACVRTGRNPTMRY